MVVWDYRLKEIKEALERYETFKRSNKEESANKELEYISKHIYSLQHGV